MVGILVYNEIMQTLTIVSCRVHIQRNTTVKSYVFSKIYLDSAFGASSLPDLKYVLILFQLNAYNTGITFKSKVIYLVFFSYASDSDSYLQVISSVTSTSCFTSSLKLRIFNYAYRRFDRVLAICFSYKYHKGDYEQIYKEMCKIISLSVFLIFASNYLNSYLTNLVNKL